MERRPGGVCGEVSGLRIAFRALGWRLPVLSIDPAAPPPVPGVTAVQATAEDVLPAACRELGAAF